MTRRMRIDDLTALAVPSQPAISPDGTRVAYVVRTLDTEADRHVDRLWIVGTADGAGAPGPRGLTGGPADSVPRWSPDGSRLAFLRAQDGPGQIWLLPADGGDPEQVTDLPLGAGAPVWSPDGLRIAFSAAVEPSPRGNGPIVSERLDYQADGAGIHGAVRSQLHVLDLASGECRRVTDGPHHAGEPAWAADGRTLAFTRSIGADADLTFRTGVHLLDVDDARARPRVVAFSGGVAATACFTPDGDLLVIGWPGDPRGHARLFRVPVDGGDPVDLTGHLDRNVMPGATAYPGARPVETPGGVLFCLRDRGCTHLYVVDGHEARPVLAGEGRVVSGLSVAGGTAVVALATPTSFGEIVLVDLASGAERVLTDHGASLADIELFERVPRTFGISDGTEVQGWVVRDPALSGPGPLLVDVHGGPHNAWNGAADEIHAYHQELVASGWTVLLVNPRGSDGYGESFYDAVNGAWGVADAQDVLEPVDTLVAEGLADPERLTVTGYSYGGFMTCYLTAHDDRFAAAVAGGVVSDLVSMYGTCDDGALLGSVELGGTPWQEPERYAAMSPITRVADVRTPTLILHGGGDLRCDLGQAQQWHTSLRQLGVPTQLVIYPEQSHEFILTGPPTHRLDYAHRVVGWLEQHTLAAGRPAIDLAQWERRLGELAERHHVPGAQLGILRLSPQTHDELVTASYGVLNVETQVPTTDDSLFQIGSISKVWTATVAMQLVDEGLLELDAPIVEVLPELRLTDPDVTKTVTLRHLLNHTSGIDGDVFTDTGRGDDCLEKYVGLLADAGQNHPLGATWSYCNSGYSLVGRLIEKVTGSTWDQAMRERLFTPLGLTRTITLPEEALLHGAATGHLEHEGEPMVAPVWQLPRSLGPAGLITATAADVLAFARLHLEGGVAADGTRLLSEESAAAMAAHEVDLPDRLVLGDSWGLGWIRFGWGEDRLIGHDGNTIGQGAFLRILPEQGLAVTLLTNGGNARDLYQDLFRELFAELAGVEMAEPFVPPADAEVDIAPYVGTYRRHSVLMEVFVADDGPRLRTTISGTIAEMLPDPVEEHPLVPAGPGLFALRPEGVETWAPVTFYELPTGERYLHHGVRATPRVD
ncbi:serine hydrolase [Nocardioides sp. cx-173]|uniref:serine hydrolase n=1 Tax=Nocardioides sp. cx-173 TaxID=2898796 RepID=UPI001E5AB97C|nr:serine hydrolase [Nocardioides sp. cx-173]MCD4523963.1 serine hydrolase [Nocardioides sp. cx-173]UGB41366.1 serine hydrolase [Nocardioides sp. cx-173]